MTFTLKKYKCVFNKSLKKWTYNIHKRMAGGFIKRTFTNNCNKPTIFFTVKMITAFFSDGPCQAQVNAGKWLKMVVLQFYFHENKN